MARALEGHGLDVPELGDKTLLDNSLVYWGNELGFNHIGYSVPCILAGSAGGYLKTGRYLDYIGAWGAAIISAGAAVSIIGNLHVLILAGSRLPFAMAERGELPRFLGATICR